MKFALVLPNESPYTTPAAITDAAVAAEEAGFDAMLAWDHYMLPWGNETLEVLPLLAYVAAKTNTIKLGTCVTPLPFRPPGMLAKAVATLDLLSGGRTILGVGAGWHRPEFDAYSQWDPSTIRFAKTKEALQLMINLWTQRTVDFHGKFYTAKDAVLEPKPLQKPHPPLWFGTTGSSMLKLAAKHGSGWIPVNISITRYRAVLDTLQSELKAQGRSRGFTYAVDNSPPDDFQRLRKELEEFKDAGCQVYGVCWEKPSKELLQLIRRMSKEILPSFQ
ncbi:MAG: LLM class flavin-dependent oxidoreductase [Candidatus Bathyarchaeia archaeon]